MTEQPQWMTDELLERWRSEAIGMPMGVGGPATHFTFADKIMALISALRAARANKATEAMKQAAELCVGLHRSEPILGWGAGGALDRAADIGRDVLAEREAAKPKPRWTAEPAPQGRWVVRLTAEGITGIPDSYTEQQARAVADALNREAERG